MCLGQGPPLHRQHAGGSLGNTGRGGAIYKVTKKGPSQLPFGVIPITVTGQY